MALVRSITSGKKRKDKEIQNSLQALDQARTAYAGLTARASVLCEIARSCLSASDVLSDLVQNGDCPAPSPAAKALYDAHAIASHDGLMVAWTVKNAEEVCRWLPHDVKAPDIHNLTLIPEASIARVLKLLVQHKILDGSPTTGYRAQGW